MKDHSRHAIHERFNTLVDLAVKLEKIPRRFGTDELLTGSEMHLVEMIGDNEESLSVTELARLLGVTKGAVSQNLKKLNKKGITAKMEDPANLSRSIIKLTSKGKTAFYAHKYWHETMDGGFKAYLTKLSQEKIDFLFEFMAIAEDFMKRAMK